MYPYGQAFGEKGAFCEGILIFGTVVATNLLHNIHQNLGF